MLLLLIVFLIFFFSLTCFSFPKPDKF